MRFQSTLPMRGATPKGPNRSRRKTISIHAPHAGSDSILKVTCQVIFNFNPRSPCGERHHYHDCYRQKYKFQSTLPMRGATFLPSCLVWILSFQSTLPMRGATVGVPVPAINADFNPRSPCGERLEHYKEKVAFLISIHAPHAGSDGSADKVDDGRMDFNPRSPCGERLAEEGFNFTAVKFQSTLPMRGATGSVYRL